MLPFIQWNIAVLIVFNTEWGWAHPAWALLLLTPGFCLVNSKIIVCNFTKMDTGMWESALFWILLFPLNNWLGNPYEEWVVATIVGLANLLTYSIFVKCTIDQICGFLDIYCLSIKKPLDLKPKKQ